MKSILLYIKHFLVVTIVLLIVAVAIALSLNADINYGDNPLAYKVGDEGPFIFFQDKTIVSETIRGDREQGFSVERQTYPLDTLIPATVTFNADSSTFSFAINPQIYPQKSVYEDGESIFVISDLEGNFGTFRDFLLTHKVIDQELKWDFGKGHLVLLGDFVDRGDATTQLLWFIYKLEQEARAAGGNVHYIIGNHEIKNLQGNFKSASNKYIPISGILGRPQSDLFANHSLIGRWLESKNSIEMINGVLFTHGGLHPQLAEIDVDINQINTVTKQYYRQMYYPGVADDNTELLISTKTGLSWYRGYFEDDLNQQEIEQTLAAFIAEKVVVGHTLQRKVNTLYEGKVIAIDVKHPSYYRGSFPSKSSEGLLIENGSFYRLLDNGQREEL